MGRMNKMVQTKYLNEWVNEISTTLSTLNLYDGKISEDIRQSLSKELWPFQTGALTNLEFLWSENGKKLASDKNYDCNHLLFNMATGTGKTLLIAASILEAYKLGYQRVLFFVPKKSIIEKTKDNLINYQSPKYMFSQEIVINGETIHTRNVESFSDVVPNGEIQIIFQTVTGLHRSITNTQENATPLDQFARHKILLIGDEAHHLSATTVNISEKQMNEENRHWEDTVNYIYQANLNDTPNLLLEFSATINWDNQDIFNKYWNKVVYQYTLPKFMTAGYSKTVRRIESGLTPQQTMLNTILLSQYRKDLAWDNGFNLKPVVLFKSNSIPESNSYEQEFKNMIENLNISAIEEHFKLVLPQLSKSSVLHTVAKYYESSDVKLSTLVQNIQQDFRNVINMNTGNEYKNLKIVNTLEEPSNRYRVIFNVDKLNEGWDVLNLFDIAKLSVSKDVKKPKNMGKVKLNKSYQQEAQLIGRGTRLYRYKKNNKRLFDGNAELEPLERVYYHTSNNNGYISYLTEALRRLGVESSSESNITFTKVQLKEDFKKSNFYKNGHLLVNEYKKTDSHVFNDLNSYGITGPVYVSLVKKINETNFADDTNELVTDSIKFDTSKIKYAVWLKALHQNPKMRFNKVLKFIPGLKSNTQLINDLIHIRTEVILEAGCLIPYDINTQFKVAKQIVDYVATELNKPHNQLIGLKTPKIKYIKDVFDDYTIEIDSSISIDMLNQMNRHNNQEYFFQKRVLLNSYEHSLVDHFEYYTKVLKQKGFENIWLLRNDEHHNKLTLVDTKLNGNFMPDFILYFEKKTTHGVDHYQMFLEPKGEHLMEHDKWKENLLLQFRDDEEMHELFKNFQDNGMKISGTKFFSPNSSESLNQLEDDLSKFSD